MQTAQQISERHRRPVGEQFGVWRWYSGSSIRPSEHTTAVALCCPLGTSCKKYTSDTHDLVPKNRRSKSGCATMCPRRIINEGDRPLSDLLCHIAKREM